MPRSGTFDSPVEDVSATAGGDSPAATDSSAFVDADEAAGEALAATACWHRLRLSRARWLTGPAERASLSGDKSFPRPPTHFFVQFA